MSAALSPFGTPGSIRPEVVRNLPPQMQAEAVRLLIEMGQRTDQLRSRTGLTASEIHTLMMPRAAFQRGGEMGEGCDAG